MFGALELLLRSLISNSSLIFVYWFRKTGIQENGIQKWFFSDSSAFFEPIFWDSTLTTVKHWGFFGGGTVVSRSVGSFWDLIPQKVGAIGKSCHKITDQPMVNWWFGLVVWTFGSPLWKGLLLRVPQNPKSPTQTTHLPIVELGDDETKLTYLTSDFGG